MRVGNSPLLIVKKGHLKKCVGESMKSTKNVASVVSELIAPVAEDLGYVLWDVEFVKEGARHILRVTIDSEEGINIDDCEKMHRAIDPVLDEADPIENAYYLEVSSPGIERELRTDAHVAACLGEKVELRLYAPVNGTKSFTGVLGALGEDGSISVEVGGEIMSFARKDVAKLRTVFDFDE